jgi:hypothetical protein
MSSISKALGTAVQKAEGRRRGTYNRYGAFIQDDGSILATVVMAAQLCNVPNSLNCTF